MSIKNLQTNNISKGDMANCGAMIIAELTKGDGKTFFELCELLNCPGDVVRATLDILAKNGVVGNMLGKYVLEVEVSESTQNLQNKHSNRRKYCAIVPAKINLSLAVVGKKDKLHTLDMIFCPYDAVWDEAEFLPGDELLLLVENNTHQDTFDADRFSKTIMPKVEKLAKKFGVSGKVTVKKGVPLGAGIGGSTAALVAVYYAFKKYADENGLEYTFAKDFFTSLSSDFPAMALGRACRVQGVGDKVTPVDENVKIEIKDFKIANSGSDTAAVYAKFDEQCKVSQKQPPQTVFEAIKAQRNDLFAPACSLNKEIKKVYKEMKAANPSSFVLMSGSGSGIVAIDFETV